VTVLEGAPSFFFYVLASLTLVSAVMVVTRRNPVHAAMFLVFAFFCVAGIYVTLSAEFLAAVQVLVYAGGIVVLFLFVIMLVPLAPRLSPTRLKQGAIALLLAGALASAALLIYERSGMQEIAGDASVRMGTIEAVGMELYTRYLLPFEVASVLLLVAMIGAVVLARKEI